MTKKIVISIITVCLVLLSAVNVFAEENQVFGGSVKIEGNTLNVSVAFENVEAHSGQFALKYDSSVVRLIEAKPGASIENAEIKAINTEAGDNTAISAGFADLELGASGEVLTAKFELINGIPDSRKVVFNVEVSELSDVLHNSLLNDKNSSDVKSFVYDITAVFEDSKSPEPTNPAETSTPTATADPGETSEPTASEKLPSPSPDASSKPTGSGGSTDNDANTGDNGELFILLILLVLAASIICVVHIFEKKKKRNIE